MNGFGSSFRKTSNEPSKRKRRKFNIYSPGFFHHQQFRPRKGSHKVIENKRASYDEVEPRRQSVELMKIELDLNKNHSDKGPLLHFSNSSKLHKRIIKRNADWHGCPIFYENYFYALKFYVLI